MVSYFHFRGVTRGVTGKNFAKSEKIITGKKLGKSPENRSFQGFLFLFGGDKRDRTADLLNAIQGETLGNTGFFGDKGVIGGSWENSILNVVLLNKNGYKLSVIRLRDSMSVWV